MFELFSISRWTIEVLEFISTSLMVHNAENSLLSFFEHAVNRKKNIINFFTSLIYNFFKRLWKIIN